MKFELGVYTFGNTPHTVDSRADPPPSDTGRAGSEKLADEVSLDFFGFGEHHTPSMPVLSPTSLVIAAAAASTQQIKLGTAVSVLSTDEPIQAYQQLATAGAILGFRCP